MTGHDDEPGMEQPRDSAAPRPEAARIGTHAPPMAVPDPDPAVAVELETARSLRQERRRVMALALTVAVFMAAAHLTPLRAWITNVQEWKAFVQGHGWVASALFLAACSAAVLLGIPRLPLCLAAGLIFGFAEGLLLSLIGTASGSYGAFAMARAGARKAVAARLSRWPWLRDLLKEPSLLRVFWVRQLMLPGIVINVLLALTAVGHGTFLAGTVLGYLPLNIAFSLVGSGLGKADLALSLAQLLAALGVVNILGWLVWRLVKKTAAARGGTR